MTNPTLNDILASKTAPSNDSTAPLAIPFAYTVPGTLSLPLDAQRLRRAKAAYTVRSVSAAIERSADEYTVLTGTEVRPNVGDVVLATVVEIGQHKKLESAVSRRQTLYVGDEVLVAYGNRYAPDQFLAHVPSDLGFVDLVAAGGMAAQVEARHAKIDEATRLAPIGLLCRDGERVNVRDLAVLHEADTAAAAAERINALEHRPHITVVFGSSMNSGKSTTVANLVRGLSSGGMVVAAGKATGTGSGNDANLFRDAGAQRVLDFTDFGYPSTYLLGFEKTAALTLSMLAELCADGPDAIVLEIADGLFQHETAQLLELDALRDIVDSVLFACGEALSAVAGSSRLLEAKLPLQAVTGLLTASPLIAREATAIVDVPVVDTFMLTDPEVARAVLTVGEQAHD